MRLRFVQDLSDDSHKDDKGFHMMAKNLDNLNVNICVFSIIPLVHSVLHGVRRRGEHMRFPCNGAQRS